MLEIVSIITVNYNGRKLLGDFLNSTRALDYPKENFEVIVVDNASTDDSVNFVRRNFPEVRVIQSSTNLGFGRGNNLGIKNAKGDFFFLVNNDTVLDRDILQSILECYRDWGKRFKIGAVNAKMILFDKYFPITIKGARFVELKTSGKTSSKNPAPIVFVHDDEKVYWEEVYLPFSFLYKDSLLIRLKVRNAGLKHFEVHFGKKALKGTFNIKLEPKALHLSLGPDDLKKYSIDFVQNAGSIIFRDGFGRDRGAAIIKRAQFYEVDQGQYGTEEQIQAFCGAGVLLNRNAVNEVGLFDKNFFMYYEDTDLSLRFKRAGWEIVYCPNAVIRHIHAGSSKEWSPFFIFQVERNRLLLVSKHWPRVTAIREWFYYFLSETLGFLYLYYHHGKAFFLERFKLRLKVNISLILPFMTNLLRMDRLSGKDLKRFW